MKIKAVDIAQMASAPELIFQALKSAIARGDIAEGEVLRQDHIARMFNVSRIPVREALTRLEEQGLVVGQRYRGAVVSALSTDEVREIFEFRALLEPEVLRLSVERLSPAQLKQAAKHHEAFGRELNPSRWNELNRDFHFCLYAEAGRPYYLQVIASALNRVDRYLRAQLALTKGMERAKREHGAILDACLRGDTDAAVSLTRRHILDAGESLIGFLERERAAQKQEALE